MSLIEGAGTMTVRKNITLSDKVAAALNDRLAREAWRKGNFSGLVDELLYRQLEEEGVLKDEEAGK